MNRREFILATAPLLVAPVACARRAATAGTTREPIALATADTESHVVEVGVATGRIHGRVATLEGPHGIQSGPGGVAIVAHTGAGA
ncbi:MAG: hypothetical protein JWN32_3285, partial [Solirubrobacterales bacterium]|nr:hypothetical protein [Solirubrobacterales bacterium]